MPPRTSRPPTPDCVASRLLAQLYERTATSVGDIIRTRSAGLLLMTTGPYLAWLALDFLERLPGAFLRPVPVTLGRFRYRSGFVAGPLQGTRAFQRRTETCRLSPQKGENIGPA